MTTFRELWVLDNNTSLEQCFSSEIALGFCKNILTTLVDVGVKDHQWNHPESGSKNCSTVDDCLDDLIFAVAAHVQCFGLDLRLTVSVSISDLEAKSFILRFWAHQQGPDFQTWDHKNWVETITKTHDQKWDPSDLANRIRDAFARRYVR